MLGSLLIGQCHFKGLPVPPRVFINSFRVLCYRSINKASKYMERKFWKVKSKSRKCIFRAQKRKEDSKNQKKPFSMLQFLFFLKYDISKIKKVLQNYLILEDVWLKMILIKKKIKNKDSIVIRSDNYVQEKAAQKRTIRCSIKHNHLTYTDACVCVYIYTENEVGWGWWGNLKKVEESLCCSQAANGARGINGNLECKRLYKRFWPYSIAWAYTGPRGWGSFKLTATATATAAAVTAVSFCWRWCWHEYV